jgi:cytochrome c peroxidase
MDGTVACAGCHDPARAFTDGRPASFGVHGRVGQRNAPTVMNALYNKFQFWDGRVRTLEEQAALPITNPIEMGQPSLEAAVAALSAIPEYRNASQKYSAATRVVPTSRAPSPPTSARCCLSIPPLKRRHWL